MPKPNIRADIWVSPQGNIFLTTDEKTILNSILSSVREETGRSINFHPCDKDTLDLVIYRDNRPFSTEEVCQILEKLGLEVNSTEWQAEITK